jgi:DNA-directed RNA polymerase subunit RPC12/RpoP
MVKVTYACIDCGKEKTGEKSKFTQPRETYRCPPCAAKNRSGKKNSKITCKCVDCGKERTGNPSTFKHIKNGGVYRCRLCMNKYISTTQSWKDNHAKGIIKRSANPDWKMNVIRAGQKRSEDPTWIKNHMLQLEQLHNNPVAQANQKAAVKISSKTPEWISNNKAVILKLQTDPVCIENRNVGYKKRSENEVWLKNVTESNRKKINDPVWIENHKTGCEKRSEDPTWIENNKKSMQIRSQNLEWRSNNKKAMQLRALDPIWIERNKEIAIERAADFKWRENHLISISGQGFWYGHPIINKQDQIYCELWKDVNPRVHAFFNNKCCLCGTEETTISHVGHHVFYVKEACCWHNEDGEYYTNLNVNTHRKDEYYIGDNPNYFVILCQSCHGKTNGTFENRKKWADYFKNMIDEKYEGKCYLTKEEYEKYKLNK